MTNFPKLLLYLASSLRRLRWDERKLLRYQQKRLRSVINHAYASVPFYHKWFKEAGIRPTGIFKVSDLSKIPIVKKDYFRQQALADVVSHGASISNLLTLSTSGSTGRPLTFFLSRDEDDWRKAIYMRANVCCGQMPWDKWVVIAGPQHFGRIGRLQNSLGIFTQSGISVFDDVGTQISEIKKLNPDVLDGYSSSLLLLAKQMQKTGEKEIRPKIVFGNAEVIDDSSRKYIERVFSAPYCDQYGCVEFNRTAWQCLERANYHMDADSVIMQFVDKDGVEVSAGERGEIICTSLFNYKMPFIRYEVGDIGVPSDEKCSCGRKTPLMNTIEGRKDSLILLPDGRLLSPRALTIAMSMFKLYNQIDQFRFVQRRPDEFEVYIKKKDGRVDEEIMGIQLREHVEKMLNVGSDTITLEIKFVEDIPQSKSGKLMAVISELKSNP